MAENVYILHLHLAHRTTSTNNCIFYMKKYLEGVGFEPTNTRMYPDLNGAPLTTWLPYHNKSLLSPVYIAECEHCTSINDALDA